MLMMASILGKIKRVVGKHCSVGMVFSDVEGGIQSNILDVLRFSKCMTPEFLLVPLKSGRGWQTIELISSFYLSEMLICF